MYEIGLSCGMSKKEQEDDNRGGNEQADNGPVDDEHRRQKCRRHILPVKSIYFVFN